MRNKTIKKDLFFLVNNTFDRIFYDKETLSWDFYFFNTLNVRQVGFWRLLKNQEILLVSSDHGQKFGLPEPVDLVLEVSKHLKEGALLSVKIKKTTGDLSLIFASGFEIEILISSGGYESYNLHLDNKNIIGCGGGELAIFCLLR